jgi:LysM repeat protein
MAMALMLAVGMASAQSVKPHKVKKNETIYGIARDNGLSVDQLVAVNPGMERPDYVLKKSENKQKSNWV